MFRPRIYKSNNLEGYHLISDDGGSFLYEGRVEYSEDEIFKDEQGRAYCLVTTDLGGPLKYYVEVEPEGRRIPVAEVKTEKTISRLVMASPKGAPAEEEKGAEGPGPAEPMPPVAPSDTCFEGPEKPAMAHVPGTEEETPEIAGKPPEPKPSTAEEAQAAVKAMASLGEHRPRKKRKIFSLPVVLLLILVAAVVVAVAVGVYVYKPDLISGLHIPVVPKATPTPTPISTPVPTAMPTSVATPMPSSAVLPGGTDIYPNLLALVPAIDSNNASVVSFATNNSNLLGTSSSKLARMCDLFDQVNKKWEPVRDRNILQNASESVLTLKGSARDYGVLMAALGEAEGLDSRIVAVYHEENNSYAYYPEIKVATNSSGYEDVKTYLRGRYDIHDPYGQTDGNDRWLSLSMGKTPGLYVDSKYGMTVNSRKEISPV